VSFDAITLCVAFQRVFIVVYFVIDSVRKLLDTPSYVTVLLQAPFVTVPSVSSDRAVNNECYIVQH
jgi:hypothetical protein